QKGMKHLYSKAPVEGSKRGSEAIKLQDTRNICSFMNAQVTRVVPNTITLSFIPLQQWQHNLNILIV
ncbi:unnamed protein product, partial [Ceratitis capitata]